MSRVQSSVLTAIVVLAIAGSAFAQTSVSPADIQRLQESLLQAGGEVSQLRNRDSAMATQLQTQLDDLRDEVIYLKVKLRKERTLARSEYADVRDRIDDLRSRATRDVNGATTSSRTTTAPAAAAATTTTRAGSGSEIPAGTEIDVRLSHTLNSGTAKVEDRFEGTTLADVSMGGRAVIPAGSVMRGVVTSVEPATRTNRTAKMTVSFDQVTVNGRSYPIRATVSEALQGEGIKGEAGRIGAGAGVGAVIGGILGGFKGALAGILIGGGGTIAATEGKEVELPQGTTLRVRFDSPVTIR